MRVNLAFNVFDKTVVHAMDLHKQEIERQYKNLEPTRVFIDLMAKTIEAMTSRFPAEALRCVHSNRSFSCADGKFLCVCFRPGSAKEATIDRFLAFLDKWESHARVTSPTHAKVLGFLSQSTSEGLRVTLHATKDLLKYLTEKVGFRFLMTSRLSSDCLERSFGIVRQSSGANDHPTPAQFIVIIKYAYAFQTIH